MSSFQDEFELAVQREMSIEDLVEIVVRHKSYGLSQVEAYCTLGNLRRDLGCDEDDSLPVCESIEEVMDRMWGFCADSEKIWNEILSDEEVRKYRAGERQE